MGVLCGHGRVVHSLMYPYSINHLLHRINSQFARDARDMGHITPLRGKRKISAQFIDLVDREEYYQVSSEFIFFRSIFSFSLR